MARPAKLIEPGTEIEDWTVLRISENRRPTKEGPFWICRCRCGRIQDVHGGSLRTGDSKRCRGCANTRRQKRFGRMPEPYWTIVKRGARDRGIEVKMTPESAWDIFVQQGGQCVLTGLPLSFANVRLADKRWPQQQTASLDRIDSDGDYEIGNVRWVHKTVNIMRRAMTDNEFINWCRLVVRHENRKRKAARRSCSAPDQGSLFD